MKSEESPNRNSASEPEEQPLSPPDLRQWMDTVWTQVFGFPARSTDVLVVQTISDQTVESRVDAITNLLWDHWMGEPDDPSLEQVREFVLSVGQDLASAADEESPEGS